METSDIQAILRLFQGSPFPRTISTYATGGRQVCVMGVDEMFEKFKEASFVDCRINAYPALAASADESSITKQPPDFVMADLDLCKFRTERMLIKALDETSPMWAMTCLGLFLWFCSQAEDTMSMSLWICPY